MVRLGAFSVIAACNFHRPYHGRAYLKENFATVVSLERFSESCLTVRTVETQLAKKRFHVSITAVQK